MRYLSRKLFMCAIGILLVAFTASVSFAEKKGDYSISVSPSDAGSYSVLDSSMMSGNTSLWVDDTSLVSIDEYVVMTMNEFTMAGTSDQYIISVSYDFSVISGSLYANTSTPLTFYSDYVTKTVGTADFQNMTATNINSVINSSDKTLSGYLVLTLAEGTTYRPAVVVNTGEFSISPVSADMHLVTGSSDTLAFEAQNYSGSVVWEVIDYSSSYYYPVTTSIASSDSGHSAVLTFKVPASADFGQEGYIEVIATDQSTGAWASSFIDYDVGPQVTLTPSVSLISVDLDSTARIGLTVTGIYSGDAVYSTSEELWTSFEDSDNYTMDFVISPYARFLEGGTWPVDISVWDDRWLSGDERGQASATINVYIYGPLSLDVSSTEFTISSNDVPEVTFTAENASGDLSFEVSESWATVSDSKFVVNSIDQSLYGTTQTVTVTAKDDRGRAGNSRGEASVTLSVTISNDFVSALELTVSPASLTVEQNESATAALSASNVLGTVIYTSSVSWLTISENTITVNYNSSYAGTTQTATITATDSGRTSDNTATVELSVTFVADTSIDPELPLRLTISPTTLNVDKGGSATATLSSSNALGTVSYTSSASWLSISGNTITVNYNSSYAGTTQTATITATDSGRTSDNTATTELRVTFGDDIIPDDYELSLSISTSSLVITAGSEENVNLTLSGAGSTGVNWSYRYDDLPSGVNALDNPLGLAFSDETSASAILSINPNNSALPGEYTVHIYTETTSGTSTGGDAVIIVNVRAVSEAFSITPSSTSETFAEGDSLTIDFSAQNAQGTVSWDITNTSWETGNEPIIYSLPDTGTSVTLEVMALTAGTHSFTVMAYDGTSWASANVSLIITVPVVPDKGGTSKTPRADIAPLIDIRPANLTPEVMATLRATLGLTASDEIRTLTNENILDPVSPDIFTETAMNQLGYQLAASLSRIAVTEGGLYAFVFDVPSEYVGFSMNDLAVFSKVLGSYGYVSSGFYASAVSDYGLVKGNLLGTDGMALTNSVSEMLAVIDLEPNTESGTFFGSVVIPDGNRLPELSISTITQESFDELLPELELVSRDTTLPILRLEERHIGDPEEATEEVRQEAARNNYELAYKLNAISVDVTGYYVFEVNLPDEFTGMSTEEWRLMIVNQAKAQVSAAADPFTYFEVVRILGDDSAVNKALAMVLAQAGQSATMYLLKIIIALLLGGCETGSASYVGYGIIALAGAAIILGTRIFRRR